MKGISWRAYGIGFLATCAMLLFLFVWNWNLTALVGSEGASFQPLSCPDYFDFCSVSGSEGGQQSCVRTTMTCSGGQEPVCSKTITCAVARACEGVCCRCPNSGGVKQLPPTPPPPSPPGTDAQHGWCCVTDGQACVAMTLGQCDDASGIGFALDEGVCNRLCGGGGGRGRGGEGGNGGGRSGEEANLGLSPPSVTQDAAGRVTYVLNVFNFGPSAATDVRLALGFFGATVTLVASESSPGCVWEYGGVNCRLSSLAVGPPTASTITVKILPASAPSCAAPLKSTISVGSSVPDPVPANNGLEHQFPPPSACAATCGNGVLDPGEQCDGDSNIGTASCDGSISCTSFCLLDLSACTARCLTPFHFGSEPSDVQSVCSLNDSPDAMFSYPIPFNMCPYSSSCQSRCGNGIVDADGEECDDGNNVIADGCSWCKSDNPHCKPVESTNRPGLMTVNVVFFGINMDSGDDIRSVASLYAAKLRGLEPFRTYASKIQFWYYDLPHQSGEYCDASGLPRLPCPQLPSGKFDVWLCGKPYMRSAAMCGRGGRARGFSFVYSPYPFSSDGMANFRSWLFSHEFGHQFGCLADEYLEGNIDAPGPPNCADNMDTVTGAPVGSPWYYWKSLVGPQQFSGCSYVINNFRPTENTIMRSLIAADYGPVNAAAMADKLRFYADNPNGPFGYAPGEGPGRSLVAQVASVDASPYEEQALRLRLRRREDGSYEEAGREAVKVSHGVIPAFAQGGSVAVRIGDRTFTQTFATEDVAITESFEEGGTIRLEEYTRTPRNDVVVEVGLGTAELADAATARLPDGRTASVTVDVQGCDSTDGVRGNDCPPPMFRGEIAPPFSPALSTPRPAAPSSSSIPLAVSAMLLAMGTGIGGWIFFARLRRRNRKEKREV